MKKFFSQIHYNHVLSFQQKLVACLAALGVPFYYAGAQIKNFLYDRKLLKQTKINGAYVISVGNITTGGVGKTPIVAAIANYLSDYHKAAIISRGYGGKLHSKNVNLIKKDGQIFYGAKECGDEPFWLCENTGGNVCVLTCKNRVKAAKYAVSKLDCDLIVLDDAFQHRKIERDLNIIVFDAEKLFGNGCVLPLGPLREPLYNVKRADEILITNKNLTQNSLDKISEQVFHKFSKKPLQVAFIPEKYYDIKTLEDVNFENKKVGAFCAIGQPDSFYNYLNVYNLVAVKSYDDHHLYSQKDADELTNLAIRKNIEILVTTEKDAVKLKDLNFKNIKVCVMKLGITFNIEELLGEEV